MNRSGIINERELLLQLRNGDYHAFKKIYEIYAGRLSYKLLQLLQSEELAEDILQDIFVKVWEIRDTINPDLGFGALLYKMASNLSKNEYRRNGIAT
jgi:RNA polymerase sigma factor (sigma-70 family)